MTFKIDFETPHLFTTAVVFYVFTKIYNPESFTFYFQMSYNATNYSGNKTFRRNTEAAECGTGCYLLYVIWTALYNICCLKTYLFNLSCHSADYASPWMAVFSISERSTLTLSDRWILITAGLWHPFSTLGELIRLSFPVIFCRLRQRGIVLFLRLLLCRRCP